jgi:hypothetical protein
VQAGSILLLTEKLYMVDAPFAAIKDKSRSFRPAARVNFLAKRKQGAGFPLLVHHSFLFSVS